jgi:cob(I)alamin adenosyltransferase
MPSSRSIATRTGDDGTTSLLYGQRVPKDHPQIEAVGAFDELSVAIGVVKPQLGKDVRGRAIHELLTQIQKHLVALMGEVACAEADIARYQNSKFERIGPGDLETLDVELAALEGRGLKFDGWATPGANATSAGFELARAAARRAERRLTSLPAHGRSVRSELRQYVNRLSDLLWLLAREAEQ